MPRSRFARLVPVALGLCALATSCDDPADDADHASAYDDIEQYRDDDLVRTAGSVAEHLWPLAWTWQRRGTGEHLRDVWFTDARRGWVVGEDGVFLRTVDGGHTWTPQPSLVGEDALFEIQFIDPRHGWIVGAPNKLLVTTDGGDTWSVRATPLASGGRGLSFISATTGWIAGPSIYRTDDGGATWQRQLANDNINFWRIDFVDASHGWAAGRVENGGEDGVNGGNVIFHTSDGGATWQRQLASGGWEQGFWALDALDPSFFYVAGYSSAHTMLGEFKYVTRDGGDTWQSVPDTSNGTALLDLQFIDANQGWAVGYGGSILHTVDGGATWSVQETAAWEHWEDWSHPLVPTLVSVHFIDARTGWAVGADGTILTTTNGGAAR